VTKREFLLQVAPRLREAVSNLSFETDGVEAARKSRRLRTEWAVEVASELFEAIEKELARE
jgi:hypothetical protein